MTNALKHAFGEHDNSGLVIVRLTRTGDAIELSVSDDGKGLPAGLDVESSPTLGMQLVKTLARQLDGSVELERAPGTRCTIRFRNEGGVAMGERGSIVEDEAITSPIVR